jgi:hypothetical protein
MNSRLKERLLRIRWWIFHMNRRQLRRWLYQMTRPASDPYITGDGFRRLAVHIYDETSQRMRPGAVQEGDIIFVSTEYCHKFFEEIDPQIRARYRLITHNSDIPADEALTSLASDNVQVWYARNNSRAHPKVVPIPIGLENLYLYNVGVPHEYTELRDYSGPKANRILSGFTVATNPAERQRALQIAAAAPSVDQLRTRLAQRDYLQRLVTYKFLLSPPGNGLDSNRTWEAMYLGVVPIVKDSVAMRYFEGLGLPVWILRTWDELLSISEAELAVKHKELQGGFASPALSMEYWRRLIRESNTSSPRAASRGDISSTAISRGVNVPEQAALSGQVNDHVTSGTPLA